MIISLHQPNLYSTTSHVDESEPVEHTPKTSLPCLLVNILLLIHVYLIVRLSQALMLLETLPIITSPFS